MSSADSWEVALGWIDSPHDRVASTGWNALAGIVSTRPDEELDFPAIKRLLKRITKDIHKSPNCTRCSMNSFVIAVGGAVIPLAADALAAAKAIGTVHVDMGDNPHQLLDATGLKAGEVDLLVGGPPCQSFSTAGNRGTVQDPRGTLLWQYLRFVEALKPRFFLMENVRGLLSAALRHRPIAARPEKGGAPLEPDEQHGSVVRTFADDLQTIPGAAYHMNCFEVNAVNYGAPQRFARPLDAEPDIRRDIRGRRL